MCCCTVMFIFFIFFCDLFSSSHRLPPSSIFQLLSRHFPVPLPSPPFLPVPIPLPNHTTLKKLSFPLARFFSSPSSTFGHAIASRLSSPSHLSSQSSNILYDGGKDFLFSPAAPINCSLLRFSVVIQRRSRANGQNKRLSPSSRCLCVFLCQSERYFIALSGLRSTCTVPATQNRWFREKQFLPEALNRGPRDKHVTIMLPCLLSIQIQEVFWAPHNSFNRCTFKRILCTLPQTCYHSVLHLRTTKIKSSST